MYVIIYVVCKEDLNLKATDRALFYRVSFCESYLP